MSYVETPFPQIKKYPHPQKSPHPHKTMAESLWTFIRCLWLVCTSYLLLHNNPSPCKVTKCIRLLWPPISLSLKRKELLTFSYAKDTSGLSSYPARVKSSQCVVGDREMCVYVWVNGGRKGQTRPRKGAWDPGWRDRGRDSKKKKGKNKRWKRGWKDVGRGWGTEWKQKQEAVYVSLDGGTTPTPCHVLAHFPALEQPETTHVRTQWVVNQ